jgi:hypothetical protein
MTKMISILATKIALIIMVLTFDIVNAQNTTRWSTFVGFTYPYVTVDSFNASSLSVCQKMCNIGCDFYDYNSITKTCAIKLTDKTAGSTTIFKGQNAGSSIPGEITGLPILSVSITTTIDICMANCNLLKKCQFIKFDTTVTKAQKCYLFSFKNSSSNTIGFRLNPLPLNYNPTKMGRIDVIGNSGIVCLHATLLPTGKEQFLLFIINLYITNLLLVFIIYY